MRTLKECEIYLKVKKFIESKDCEENELIRKLTNGIVTIPAYVELIIESNDMEPTKYHTLSAAVIDTRIPKQTIIYAYRNGKTRIARRKDNATDKEYKDLASELKILIHVGFHENLVNLIGACTKSISLYVILEYCPHGNLKDFLQERSDKFEPRWFKNEEDMESELTFFDLSKIALQVARGMNYLEEKRLVHRDLAARNVLVGYNYLIKIADFGMTRNLGEDDIYKMITERMMPVRWMAPECWLNGICTSKSDVWSFGILLWEIFSLGEEPYPGLGNKGVIRCLIEDTIMGPPERCPERVYELMTKCWKKDPAERPSFPVVVSTVEYIFQYRAYQSNYKYRVLDKEDEHLKVFESDESDSEVPPAPKAAEESAMNTRGRQLPPDPICQNLKPTVPPRTAVMNIEFAQSAHPNAVSPNQSWTFVKDEESGKTLVTVETTV